MAKVKIKWSPEFAYALGLIATDGNLSPDGRHINFTSKDKELAELYKKCLGVKNKIGKKARGSEAEKKYFCVQSGDVIFYKFLLSIGLTPRKSKILEAIEVPGAYIFDFLRGHLDGDGSFHSYWDQRWKSSFMFYTIFVSASKKHIGWLQKTIINFAGIHGHITKSINDSVYQLKYAKAESLKLLPKLYYNADVVCLSRKRKKIEKALKVEGRHL